MAEAGSKVCGDGRETIRNQPRQRRARRWKKALVGDGKGACGTSLTTMDWRGNKREGGRASGGLLGCWPALSLKVL